MMKRVDKGEMVDTWAMGGHCRKDGPLGILHRTIIEWKTKDQEGGTGEFGQGAKVMGISGSKTCVTSRERGEKVIVGNGVNGGEEMIFEELEEMTRAEG